MKSDPSDLREVNSISYTPEEVSAGGYLPMLRLLVEDPRFEIHIGGDGYCRDVEFVRASFGPAEGESGFKYVGEGSFVESWEENDRAIGEIRSEAKAEALSALSAFKAAGLKIDKAKTALDEASGDLTLSFKALSPEEIASIAEAFAFKGGNED